MIFSKLFSHFSNVHTAPDSYYEIKLVEQGNATTVMFSSDRSLLFPFLLGSHYNLIVLKGKLKFEFCSTICGGQLIAFLDNSQGRVTAPGTNGAHYKLHLVTQYQVVSGLSVSWYELKSFAHQFWLPRTFSF